MTAVLQQQSIEAQTGRPAFGNGTQPVGVLPLNRRLESKGDIA